METSTRFSIGDRVTLTHDPARFAGVVGFDGDRHVKIRWEGVRYDKYRPYDTLPALLLRWPGPSREPSSVEPLTEELLAAAEVVRVEYSAFLVRVEAEGTPTLQEYRDWCRYDPNLPWRLDSGHVVNLLEAALDRIDELTADADTAAGEVASPN